MVLYSCATESSPTAAQDEPGSSEDDEPSSQDSTTSEQEDAPVPTATPEPIILFEDDFSDPNSGWEHYNEVDGVLDYHEGGYRMWVNNPDNLFWVNANQEFTDVRIEVNAQRIDGPLANQYGLMCRLDENFNYYAFLITSEGYFGIGKQVDFQFQWLGAEDWQFSDVINGAEDRNQIRADCSGDTLALFVNGQLLLEVQDDSIQGDDSGLMAGTVGEAGTDILFDDFRLLEP
jgi:hypothetical protein